MKREFHVRICGSLKGEFLWATRLGKVVPNGVYDIGKNKGWVSVFGVACVLL